MKRGSLCKKKGMGMDMAVSIKQLIDKLELQNLTPEIDITGIKVTQPDINRPALQLAGYFEHYDETRPQIIGFVEYSYMEHMTEEDKREVYPKVLSEKTPCIVFCRDLRPDEIFLETAVKNKVPVLLTQKSTSAFMAEIIRWLNVKLAPCISVHGVLVDVYGEGVLITGESGIGKSEAALELIKRGHRLVADDAVEIRRVSDKTLVGSSPANIRHFMELRGVGIINARRIFGMGSVKMTEKVDMVISLEPWEKTKVYDRMGMTDEYMEILGNKVPSLTIPVKTGRNLAVIIEVAAMNNRQKKMLDYLLC